MKKKLKVINGENPSRVIIHAGRQLSRGKQQSTMGNAVKQASFKSEVKERGMMDGEIGESLAKDLI